METLVPSNDRLEALSDPEIAKMYEARELHGILLQCRDNWQQWQQYFFVVLYELWTSDKWMELPDHNGEFYQRIGDFLSGVSRDAKISKNYLQKILGVMRIFGAQGYDPSEAAQFSINSIDAARSWFESDRKTGDVLRLSEAAERNLPLPGSPPGERVVEAMLDMRDLSPGEAIRYAQQVSGKAEYRVVPALLFQDKDTGYWHFQYKQIDDLNDTHVEITAIARTPQGEAWIQKLLGEARI